MNKATRSSEEVLERAGWPMLGLPRGSQTPEEGVMMKPEVGHDCYQSIKTTYDLDKMTTTTLDARIAIGSARRAQHWSYDKQC